jgi:hypothetical protein
MIPMVDEFLGYADGIMFAVGRGLYERLPVPCRVCRRCGAVVIDEEIHDIWHGRLEAQT